MRPYRRASVRSVWWFSRFDRTVYSVHNTVSSVDKTVSSVDQRVSSVYERRPHRSGRVSRDSLPGREGGRRENSVGIV